MSCGQVRAAPPSHSAADDAAAGHACSRAADEVMRRHGVQLSQGLTAEEAARRHRVHGPNVLRQATPRSRVAILVAQLKSVIAVLLIVGAGLALALGETFDAAAILIVIALNTVIGFAVEVRAVRSMESLRQLGSVRTRVRRDGAAVEVAAEQVVPGDIVLFEGGDVITADLRLVEASRVEADESALTGESLPVAKQTRAVPAATPLAERTSMLWKGTAVARGAGAGVVVGIGMQTEIGHITGLVEAAAEEHTPLEQRLDRLGRRLAWISLVCAAMVALAGVVGGKPLGLVLETAIALAVATVPEGLPIVATLALARGMWRMARRNALVEHLPAVETLGSTTVILTDKTGTLTEHRMTVTALAVGAHDVVIAAGRATCAGRPLAAAEQQLVDDALTIGVLCNDAELGAAGEPGSGDPMELALLAAGAAHGLQRASLLEQLPEVREEAFDPETKMMATVHRHGARFLFAVKGAPEALLAFADLAAVSGDPRPRPIDRGAWAARQQRLAAGGLRVLALARKVTDRADAPVGEQLTLVGLVGFMDPPRASVRQAIEACQRAGVRVVMATGDHAATAASVGAAVGLVDDAADAAHSMLGAEMEAMAGEAIRDVRLVARASPEQKLRLLRALQQAGEVVAMIGDGVNDAPALEQADIGIAMGVRGTAVAREAADMVLRDDDFASIPAAIDEGRVIFANLRKFVTYLLSCNLSEILAIGLAAAVNAPLPILPLQILFLNFVTDVFPALALGAGEGPPGIMQRAPRRPGEPVLTARHWRWIAAHGALLTAAVLGAFALARLWLDLDDAQAVTVSFLTLALAQLVHVFNMADPQSPLLRNEVTQNGWVRAAVVLCVALLLAAVYWPALAQVLQLRAPTTAGWLLVLVASATPTVLSLAWRAIGRRDQRTRP